MGETLTADPYAGFEADEDPYAGFEVDAPAPPAPTRAEAEAEFPMPQRFQRRPAETVGPALLKPKVQGLPPEERAGPSPYDQRTTAQNLGGAVRRGFEGQVVQPSAANAMDALDRQRRAMDAIDAGQTVDPADDPMGYGTSDASARSMIRDSVLQQMGATMGAFQESRRTAQAIPQNPRLRTMAEQIDAGQYAPAARTFLSDPGGITGQVMAESAPSILPQAVLGPASAVMGAGRGARVLWNAIGAYMGDQPARGIEILDDVMRQANVSPDDPDAMMRFIRDNPGVIGNAFRRAGLGSTGLALVSGLTAGASRPLRPAGGIRGNAASIGVNLGASLVGEPSGEAVAQGITYGEIKSPSDVALEAIGGVPMAGVNTAQETIAAARQPAQVAPAPSQPPRPPEAPPSAPAGLPPAGVAEAPPLPAAPQPGVSSPQTAGPSAQEAGAAPIPAPPPLPPMPPPPQTLAQIQAEQSVSSPEAARIRQAQEDAFIAWHDENMPGADVVMVAPGDPTPDGAVMRAELQRALQEPDVTTLPPAPTETTAYPAPDVTTPAPDVTEPNAPIYALPPTPVAVEEPEPASPADPPPIPQPSPGSRRRPQRVQQAEDVGQAAARVADPTDAQKAAGNYEKGHISVGGLPVTIENPAGSERSGIGPDGTRWTSTLGADYGYIKRTKGADGDQVDVFLGPDVGEAAKRPVYVIDQLTTGDVVKFDEHKAMVGFPSEEAARAAYLASFSDNAGTDRIGAITKMDWPQFKRWARSGDTAKALSYKPPKIQVKKPSRRKSGPRSLLEFLVEEGGLAPHGDLRAMDAHKRKVFGVSNDPRLVRPKGMSLFEAREKAEDAGYIGAGSRDYNTTDTNDLLAAIAEEMKGRRVFSKKEAGDAESARQEEAGAVEQGRRGAAEAEVNAIALVLGANPSEQETADAVQLVMGGMDAEDALAEVLERAAIQAVEEAVADAPPGSGFDIPFELEVTADEVPAATGDAGQGPETAGREAARPEPSAPEGDGARGGQRDDRGEGQGQPVADGAGRGAADAEGQGAGGVARQAAKRGGSEFSGTLDLGHARLEGYGSLKGAGPLERFTAPGAVDPDIRYDGNGGVFGGQGVYLDNAGTWTGGKVGRFDADTNYKVRAPFKRAYVITPDNISDLIRRFGLSKAEVAELIAAMDAVEYRDGAPVAGRPPTREEWARLEAAQAKVVAGEQIADRLRQEGYDGIIVQGFDAIEDTPQGARVADALSRAGIVNEILQDQVFHFYPERVQVLGRTKDAASRVTVEPTSFQSELVDTLDGKREQTLIPGVAPISEEDRKAAQTPQRPAQQAPGGMFGPVGQTDLVDYTQTNLYGSVAAPNEDALTEAFRKRIAERGDYPSTQQAMKHAGQLLGGPVLPGSRAARTVESALEAARRYRTPAQVTADEAYDAAFAEHEQARTEHMAGRMSDADYIAVRQRFEAAKKAANDADMNPREEAPQPTATPQFKRWFNGSEVVNPDGTPMRVYHGAIRFDGSDIGDITTFDRMGSVKFARRPVSLDNVGSWFSTVPDVESGASASTYAGRMKGRGGDRGVLYPVYLSIKSAWRPPGATTDAAFDAMIDKAWEAAGKPRPAKTSDAFRVDPEPLREWLQSQGHDGIVLGPYGDQGEFGTQQAWVALEPTQIKSAVGNSGEFSPDSPDIRFAIAPRVSPQAASLAAGARNLERRGDVRRGAEAILDRLRMQQNLDRAAAQRGAREGRAGVRSVTDPAAIREVDQFIQWLGEHMVRDVGLRFSNQTSGAYGMFEVGPRIVTIFRRAIDSDNLDRTMVHELWHAMENALPSADRAAVRKEYLTARDAWLGKNEWARPFLSGDQILDQLTGDDARAWLDAHPDRADMAVVVDNHNGFPRVRMAWNNETYRFRDRHEYFAETMADRYFQNRDIQDAKARSIFAHIRDIFRRMVAALKRLFGRDATGRIFDGFDRRQFQPPSAIQQWLRDETMYGALDDIRAVRQDAFLSEVRFARAPIAQTAMPMAPTATFNSPPESRLDSFIYEIQNKQIDLKRMQEAIERAGRTIGLPEDAYLAEELYHGRTAKRTQDFINEELKPLLQEMVRRGVTMDELQKFLHARHAEEYNNHIASRDPNRPDGGSGMMTHGPNGARAILAGFPQDKLLSLSALAQQVDAITARTRRTLVQYGMEPQERVDAWEQMFPYYVPLNREDMDTIYGGGAGTGRGYSVRGEFSRPALGSDRDVANIIASIALQRERAIVRGEKNIVANAVIELARRNPNPDVWEVNRPTRIRVLEGGQVVSKVDPNYKGRDNVIVARSLATSGPGAGRTIIERTLTLKPENERAMRMARAIKNLDMDDLGHLAPVAAATRLMASLATQYNPVFGISNIIRDVQEAAINLSSTPLAGKQREVVANVPSALRGIYTDLRAIRRGGTATNQWGRLWEQFQLLGGQTGFRDLWQTNEDRAKAIRSEINRVTEGKAKQFGRAVFGWLSDYNEALENSTRLAAFKVGLDMGMDPQRAASIAKNITVNFNRKGSATTQIAALYAFFNAATQGTTRALKTLAGPAGRKIIAGGVLLGSMQALMLAGAGFSDEDVPEFIREKNLVIPIGGKRYLTIPMPLGFSVFPNIGRISTEIVMDGGKDAGKKAAKLLGIVMGSYNPLGGSSTPLQMIMPTVADPIAAVAENKDFTGRPIARENPDSTTPKPGHALKKDVASIWSEYVSRAVNRLTFGSEFQAGMLSPSPDYIDYLAGQFAGGFVREVNKALTAGVATYRGDDVPPNKLPLVGRFYGNAEGPNAVRTAYFENVKRLNGHELEIKGRAGRGGDVAGYIAKNPEAGMAIPANREINAIANMQRARRQMEQQGIPRDRLRALDAQIAERMKRFNDMVKQAEKGR